MYMYTHIDICTGLSCAPSTTITANANTTATTSVVAIAAHAPVPAAIYTSCCLCLVTWLLRLNKSGSNARRTC